MNKPKKFTYRLIQNPDSTYDVYLLVNGEKWAEYMGRDHIWNYNTSRDKYIRTGITLFQDAVESGIEMADNATNHFYPPQPTVIIEDSAHCNYRR